MLPADPLKRCSPKPALVLLAGAGSPYLLRAALDGDCSPTKTLAREAFPDAGACFESFLKKAAFTLESAAGTGWAAAEMLDAPVVEEGGEDAEEDEFASEQAPSRARQTLSRINPIRHAKNLIRWVL